MSAVSRALSPDELALRLHQQELAANFGLLALSTTDLGAILHEASAVAARGLNTRFAKVLRFRPADKDFLVVAGVGWRAGVVGHATFPASAECPAGYALHSRQPVLANGLSEERRFRLPSLLEEHGVQSAINVVIGPESGGAYGVLEADSTHRHAFAAADASFLQAIANVLAAAIGRSEVERAKDELLREKDLLMQEVHHRVKNSLQLVQNILQVQARQAGPDARRQLDEAAGRIRTIGAVHHRLYAGSSVTQTNAAEFLQALLDDMRPIMPAPEAMEHLQLAAPPITLSADDTTVLGVVVAELVTNAAKYGARPIAVELAQTERGLRITVEDRGPGFPPGFDPNRGSGLGMRLIGTLASPGPDSITIDRSVPYGRISVLLKI